MNNKDKARIKHWRETHPERWRELNRAATKRWRLKNLDHIKEYHKKWFPKWWAEHREEQLAHRKIFYQEHKEAYQERNKKWRQTHPEAVRRISREYYARLRLKVLSHYSPKLVCQKCGFSDLRSLTIDHIKGGGAKHRRETQNAGGFYNSIIKANFPPIYQILCMNCQFIKRIENKEFGDKSRA